MTINIDIENLPPIETLTQAQCDLISMVCGSWEPPPNLSLTDWAMKYFKTQKGSFRPFGYQTGILDAIGDPAIDTVSFQKCARVGGTMISIIAALKDVSQGRAIGMVQPRESDSKDFSQDEIAPALELCPATNTLIADGKHGGRNTILHRSFTNGASLRGLSAGSPASARRISLDSLYCDETDAYEQALGEEGDALQLFVNRLGSSAMPFSYFASTPLSATTSHIVRQFEKGDQRVFECRCPECGEHEEWQFERLTIDGKFVSALDKSHRTLLDQYPVEYACSHCGSLIPESSKRQLVNEGRWKSTARGEKGHASFRLSQLVSPFEKASWRNIALQWMNANGSLEQERVFANTVLGRAFSNNLDEALTAEMLKAKATPPVDIIPQDSLLLTAGVDLGPTYAEITVLGQDGQSHRIIEHRRLDGIDPTTPDFWSQLDAYLQTKWQHELGGEIGISLVGVDSGNWTQNVYEACSKRGNWYALKGVAGEGRQIWTQSKNNPSARFQAKLYLVGTFAAKEIAFHMFAGDTLKIPDNMPDTYYEGLLGEYREVIYSGGLLKTRWKRKSSAVRVEALDCFCYAMAVSHAHHRNWQLLRDQLTTTPEELSHSNQSALAVIARAGASLNG